MAQVQEPISQNRSSGLITIIRPLWATYLHKSEPFLRQKYVKEGLSIHQISAMYGSSRTAISQALKRYGLKQTPRLNCGQLAYGEKFGRGKMVSNADEKKVIQKILSMRNSGKSYRAIADRLTSEKWPTKNNVQTWSPATVYKIVRRNM